MHLNMKGGAWHGLGLREEQSSTPPAQSCPRPRVPAGGDPITEGLRMPLPQHVRPCGD